MPVNSRFSCPVTNLLLVLFILVQIPSHNNVQKKTKRLKDSHYCWSLSKDIKVLKMLRLQVKQKRKKKDSGISFSFEVESCEHFLFLMYELTAWYWSVFLIYCVHVCLQTIPFLMRYITSKFSSFDECVFGSTSFCTYIFSGRFSDLMHVYF